LYNETDFPPGRTYGYFLASFSIFSLPPYKRKVKSAGEVVEPGERMSAVPSYRPRERGIGAGTLQFKVEAFDKDTSHCSHANAFRGIIKEFSAVKMSS